jgi:hypothetical protein
VPDRQFCAPDGSDHVLAEIHFPNLDEWTINAALHSIVQSPGGETGLASPRDLAGKARTERSGLRSRPVRARSSVNSLHPSYRREVPFSEASPSNPKSGEHRGEGPISHVRVPIGRYAALDRGLMLRRRRWVVPLVEIRQWRRTSDTQAGSTARGLQGEPRSSSRSTLGPRRRSADAQAVAAHLRRCRRWDVRVSWTSPYDRTLRTAMID